MAKTKEELKEIKKSVDELSAVLQQLTEEELNEVFGGAVPGEWFGGTAVGISVIGDESAAVCSSFMNNLFKVGGQSVEG